MKRTEIVDVLKSEKIGQEILVKGWVKAFRSNRFIQIYLLVDLKGEAYNLRT